MGFLGSWNLQWTCLLGYFALFSSALSGVKKGQNVFRDSPHQAADVDACEQACLELTEASTTAVHVRTSPVLWDGKQGDLIPACNVQPSTAEEVALILSVLVKQQCHFAVKSGGHGMNAGQNNIKDGVTIDLLNFKRIQVSDDRSTVELGPGLLWKEVYEKLEEEDLRVMGGRVADVGVGGLLMGGGISFLSGSHGWACDNVVAFEIVLPNTTISRVTAETDPELFWALHGGSSNFGIVTSFTMTTFPAAPMWFSRVILPWEDIATLVPLNEAFSYRTTDPNAMALWNYIYNADYDMFLSVPMFVHTNHSSSETWPSTFAAHLSELHPVPETNLTLLTSMSTVTSLMEQSTPPGYRSLFHTMTIIPSSDLELEILSHFRRSFETSLLPFIKNASSCSTASSPSAFVFEPSLTFQPLPLNTAIQTMSSGPFPFNLPAHSGPLTLVLISFRWSHPPPPTSDPDRPDFRTQESYDEFLSSFVTKLFEDFTALARKHGRFHPFLYPNYASASQDVYTADTSSPDVFDKLLTIQKRVDPHGVFVAGGLCGGGHKIRQKKHDEVVGTKSGKDEL